MTKKVKDITFEEFAKWCNERACDGQWSMGTAITCIEVYRKVNTVKPLFGKKKKREEEWNKIKGSYLNLEAEMEV